MMKRSKNNSSSTKQQHSGSKLKLSKICKLLGCAILFKLILVGSIVFDADTQIASILPSGTTEKAKIVAENTSLTLEERFAQVKESLPSSPATLTTTKAHAEEKEVPKKPAPAPKAVEDSMTRDLLKTKQVELNRREQELTRLQATIDGKLAKLQALEKRLQSMLNKAKETQDKKMKHLVDVYSNMKGKQAAQVLETLDEQISVKILAGMRGRKAGEILTFVRPDKAARLSEALTNMQLPFE
ncbi:MotE family protein [Halodesulfovibrio aestuarii]|uniref:MotE family protein n=1 Tax=Halodesulfovibrio aestuarii TaxID=126333 RepID=UPI003D34DFFD